MGLDAFTPNQPQGVVPPETGRALKNAVLLKKLQAMPPDMRQKVIAMAQQKRRAREASQQQGQPQMAPPQQQQMAPPQQPQAPSSNMRVDPTGFRRLAQQQTRPSLAMQMRQQPRIGG